MFWRLRKRGRGPRVSQPMSLDSSTKLHALRTLESDVIQTLLPPPRRTAQPGKAKCISRLSLHATLDWEGCWPIGPTVSPQHCRLASRCGKSRVPPHRRAREHVFGHMTTRLRRSSLFQPSASQRRCWHSVLASLAPCRLYEWFTATDRFRRGRPQLPRF